MSESEEDEVPDGELVLELVLELVIIPAMTPEAAAAMEGAAGGGVAAGVVVVEVEFEEHTVALEGGVGTVLGICTLPGRLGEIQVSKYGSASLVPRLHPPLSGKGGLVTFVLVLTLKTPSRSRKRDLQSDRRTANQITRESGRRPH